MAATKAETAMRALSLLDLTNLNDNCTNEDVAKLCKLATGKHGHTAAICIWPEFVKFAKPLLKGTNVKIATVVNFPQGGVDTRTVLAETKKAISDGADEIDLVFPYRAFIAGDHKLAADQIKKVKAVLKPKNKLKVILETGKLVSETLIRNASRLAMGSGADFIKTSTGKVPVNATPQTATIMLEEIKRSGREVGFKPAGGIKTTKDAGEYLAIADRILGHRWAGPKTLRFGASSVLADLIASIEGKKAIKTKGY